MPMAMAVSWSLPSGQVIPESWQAAEHISCSHRASHPLPSRIHDSHPASTTPIRLTWVTRTCNGSKGHFRRQMEMAHSAVASGAAASGAAPSSAAGAASAAAAACASAAARAAAAAAAADSSAETAALAFCNASAAMLALRACTTGTAPSLAQHPPLVLQLQRESSKP